MNVVGRVGNSRNEFRAADRHEMAPGYPAAAGLPTCCPRESTDAPLPSPRHLRIGNLLANFVRSVPLSTPAASTRLPSSSKHSSERAFSRNEPVRIQPRVDSFSQHAPSSLLFTLLRSSFLRSNSQDRTTLLRFQTSFD